MRWCRAVPAAAAMSAVALLVIAATPAARHHVAAAAATSTPASSSADAPSDVVVLTDENFEEHVAAGRDMLVEFYAPWCGHCKRLQPVWERVATDLKASVVVAKVDGTTQRGLAARFPIAGYPTIFFVSAEQDVRKFHGARSAENIKDFAMGAWVDGEELPYWSSPFTLPGQLKGIVVSSVWRVKHLHTYTMEGLDVGPLAAAALLACASIVVLFVGVLGFALWSSKVKRD